MKLKWPFSLEALKKIEKNHLLIAALIGVLLFVIVIPLPETEKTAPEQSTTQSTGEGSDNSDAVASNYSAADKEAYKNDMEKQLKEILQSMEGVGRVEVMLTLKDMGEAVVEKDFTRSEQNTTEEDSEGTKRENQSTDTQEATVYDQGDGSNQVPFIKQEVNPKVEGVVVVAEGGQSPVVVKNISDAVLALFSIEPHKIKVVKLN